MKKFIKELMNKKGIKQKELAQILGISPSAISQWEAVENISPEILYKLSKLFSVTVDNLIDKRFDDESNREKFDRLYNVDDYNFDEIIEEGDRDKLNVFCLKLKNINDNLHNLLYLKMANELSVDEKEELEYLSRYIRFSSLTHPYFTGANKVGEFDLDRDEKVAEIIKQHVSIDDKEGFEWELKKLYSCNKKIEWKKVMELLDFFDGELLLKVLSSYRQMERDNIVKIFYDNHRLEAVKYFLNLDDNIHLLYDRATLNCRTVSSDMLERLEGKKVAVDELNEAREVLEKMRSKNYSLTYSDYQKIINRRLERILRNERNKEQNPIKYWENFKAEQY